MYERNDELSLAMADFLAIALQEGDNDGTNILEAYGYEVVDEILDGFLKELSEDYGFHIYRPMIVTEKSFRMMNMISTAWTSRKIKRMKLRRANNPSLFIWGVDRVAYGGGLENR